MPSLSRDQLRRLYFIDSLFAPLTGHDLYLARQIQEAIAFSLAELEAQTRDHPELAARYDAEFNAAAARLLQRFFNDQRPGHGFFHWDALSTSTSATPLFARAELMTGLKRLTPFRESTLLVTNLRPAFLPPQTRATPRRQRDYAEALRYVQDLAAHRIHPEVNLQLLFL